MHEAKGHGSNVTYRTLTCLKYIYLIKSLVPLVLVMVLKDLFSIGAWSDIKYLNLIFILGFVLLVPKQVWNGHYKTCNISQQLQTMDNTLK